MINVGDVFNVEAISLTALNYESGNSIKLSQDTKIEVLKVFNDQKIKFKVLNNELKGESIILSKGAIDFPCSKL